MSQKRGLRAGARGHESEAKLRGRHTGIPAPHHQHHSQNGTFFFFFLTRMNLIDINLDFPQLLVKLNVFSKIYQPFGYILLSADNSCAHFPIGVFVIQSVRLSLCLLGVR